MAKFISKSVFNQNKRFSAIFFDLDNTLIATRKGDALACDKVGFLYYNLHDLFYLKDKRNF